MLTKSEEKKVLRKEVLSVRSCLSVEEVYAASKEICKKIISDIRYISSKNICIYMPIKNEVNVELLFSKYYDESKNYFIPKTEGNNMAFYRYTGKNYLKPGRFNIPEPIGNIEPDYSLNTLIIMPGAVFSKDNGRIGYGGGYYDRFLKAHETCNTIAVCYSFQIKDKIPQEKNDIKPQIIISGGL